MNAVTVAVAILLVAVRSEPDPTPPITPAPTEDIAVAYTQNLLVVATSFLSMSGCLFCFILVAHTPQLRNTGNYLFLTVLAMNLFNAIEYFNCVLFVEVKNRDDKLNCDSCGFLEQVFSFCEPCLNALFWIHMMMECNGVSHRFRRRFGMIFVVLVLIVGIGSATWALLDNMYSSDGQSWCWVSERHTWFRISFCWAWVGVTVFVMLVAITQTLIKSRNAKFFRRFLLRRGALVVTWALINGINVVARYVVLDWLLVVQAGINPLTGVANVLSFLWSEDHLNWYAISRSPCEECPQGFSAALKLLNREAYNTSQGEAEFGSSSSPDETGLLATRSESEHRNGSYGTGAGAGAGGRVEYGSDDALTSQSSVAKRNGQNNQQADLLQLEEAHGGDEDGHSKRNRPSVDIWSSKRPNGGLDDSMEDF